MTSPGGPPRFRIDPRAPPAPRPAPPAPPAPAAASPPPPPRAAPPVPPRAGRPRWLVPLVVAVVVLLVGGGSVAAFVLVKRESYPQKYFLAEDEMPRGVRLSTTADDTLREEFGARSNPGRISNDKLDEYAPNGAPPDEGWVQMLDTPQTDSGAIVIIASRYPDEDTANGAVGDFRFACSFGAPVTLLQDGDVVVLVGADNGFDAGYRERVVTALVEKASGLRRVCG